MIISPSLPSGHIIFCDEIITEESGKITLVGTYTGGILIHSSLPTVLPKICMLITFMADPLNIPSEIKFNIEFASINSITTVATATMGIDAEAAQNDFRSGLAGFEDDGAYFAIQNFVELPNLEIPSDGKLQVRAIVADDEIRLGSIRISAIDAETV